MTNPTTDIDRIARGKLMNKDELIEVMAEGVMAAMPTDRGTTFEQAAQQYAQAALSAIEAAGGVVVQGWQPIESAPHACHVLASRFSEDHGEWIMAVVASPPAKPFTHWMPLPAAPLAADRGRE